MMITSRNAENPTEALARSREDIAEFFAPKRGIALVGSVDTSPFFTQRLQRYGESVDIAFVNPKGPGDTGQTVYRSISELPSHFDLVIVRTPAPTAPAIVEQCRVKGIKNVLVFTSGFSEVGGEGAALEAELAKTVAAGGIRLIGPNTNENAFERFALPEGHRGGLIGLITQSGFNGRPLVEGVSLGAAFQRWVTTGNEVDLDVADFINFFAADPQTTAIAAYVEGFRSGPKLRAALAAANAQDKPVVMLKIGATSAGSRMAASHTGHLSGSDAVVNGLFRQHAVTRVNDLDELLETANLFSKLPAGTGAACALYSVSGGSATLMAEHAEAAGLPVPTFYEVTRSALHERLPRYLTVSNPVDNGGQFVIGTPQARRFEVLDLIAADPAIDVVVVGLTAAYGPLSDGFAADIRAWAPTASKPVVAVWGSVVTDTPGYRDLVASGVPIFRSFRNCFRALRAFADHQAARATLRTRAASSARLTADQAAALDAEGVLGGDAAARLLQAAGIPLVAEAVARSAGEARALAQGMRMPIVMKVVSPAFPHKSDVGLVRLGVPAESVAEVFEALVARARALDPAAPIDGVVLQEQLPAGVEMLVGLTTDPVLGPALTVGAGGVQTELLKDVAVRPLPVDRRDVEEMIEGLRIAPLLRGYRGAPPADIEAFIGLVLRIAALGEVAAGRIAELDLNPVIVAREGAVAVDSLVVSVGQVEGAGAPVLAACDA